MILWPLDDCGDTCLVAGDVDWIGVVPWSQSEVWHGCISDKCTLHAHVERNVAKRKSHHTRIRNGDIAYGIASVCETFGQQMKFGDLKSLQAVQSFGVSAIYNLIWSRLTDHLDLLVVVYISLWQ